MVAWRGGPAYSAQERACRVRGLAKAVPCRKPSFYGAAAAQHSWLLQLLPISLILSSEADLQLLQLPHAFQPDLSDSLAQLENLLVYNCSCCYYGNPKHQSLLMFLDIIKAAFIM